MVNISAIISNSLSNHPACCCDKKNLVEVKILLGKLLAKDFRDKKVLSNIQEAEFSVFSQFGDDGIIQYLINILDIPQKTFIEFGVQDYTESNTRYLLVNNNWRGLIIDCGHDCIEFIRRDDIYWKYDITAVESFITKDNINEIFIEYGFKGEIGILSIDIDGNDYWIWKEINTVKPVIVIAEYNSVFGSKKAVTVPYNPNFIRTNAHFSNLYWGCSLQALLTVAKEKGYTFIGSNSNGNNAYFIRNDKVGKLKALTNKEGYVESRFRESRDVDGKLTYSRGKDRLEVIKEMEVYDIEIQKRVKIKDL